jgi:hypothetical protein
VNSREILTPAQNAQEALNLERERARPQTVIAKNRPQQQQQAPTADAVTVLDNEAGRSKTTSSRRKQPRVRKSDLK